ncbi:MAG: TonB-dependent receptor, partial [Pseudohongiella sp.]|nr:TonB-dependent receptor [Pseudohongiella sp.]
ETGVIVDLIDGLTWYNSASYNQSKIDDDYFSGTTRVNTAGKTVVDSPEWMFNSVVSYEMERAFAKVHLKYTGDREYTFLNEGSVESSTIINVSAGYRFGNLGMLKELTAQVDLTNLIDREYISTVGSGGFGNSDPNGTAQTLLPGAPRQLFLSLKAAF